MATSIGSLVVKISADATAVTTGLEKATSAVKDFGTKTPALMGGFASMAKGGFALASAAASKFGDVLDKPLDYLSNFAKNVPLVGQTLALPFDAAKGLMDTYAKGAAEIEKLGKAAGRSGTDLASFQAVQFATKQDADALSNVMFRMNAKLAEAAMGADEAKGAFQRYGLSAKELFKMNGVDRFAAIADAVSRLKDPALQAKAAFDLVGKKGGDMLFALTKGGAAVRDKAGLLDRLGLKVTDQDFKNIKEAGELAKTIKNFKDAVTMQVTKGVAPFLAELNARMAGTELGAKGLSGYVQTFLSGFVYATSTAYSWWKKFTTVLPDGTTAFTKLQAGATGFLTLLTEGLTVIISRLSDVMDFAAGFADAAGGGGKEAMGFSGGVIDRLTFGAFSGKDDADGKLKDWSDRFKKAREDLGKSFSEQVGNDSANYLDGVMKRTDLEGWRAKKLKELEGAKGSMAGVGAMLPQTGTLRDLWEQARGKVLDYEQSIRKAAAATNEMTKEGMLALKADQLKALEDANRSPLERLQKDMQELNDLAAAAKPFGLMSDAQHARAAGRLTQDFIAAANLPGPRSAGAAEQGSREAYSAAVSAMLDADRGDPQKQLVEAMKQQTAATQRLEAIGGAQLKLWEQLRGRDI